MSRDMPLNREESAHEVCNDVEQRHILFAYAFAEEDTCFRGESIFASCESLTEIFGVKRQHT